MALANEAFIMIHYRLPHMDMITHTNYVLTVKHNVKNFILRKQRFTNVLILIMAVYFTIIWEILSESIASGKRP